MKVIDILSEAKQSKDAPKPRNFVAKNAINTGAGAHKDKKKAAKQGDVKHKNKEMAETKQRLDAKCWKGKHKEGTKMKGGVRVNNCVPNESINEYGDTPKGQKMLTKVQKRAVDRVVSKKADTDPAYAKKNKETADRAWDRMSDKDVAEGLKDPKDNPCWKGYKPVGTKKKGGRTVPNCVPKESIEENSKVCPQCGMKGCKCAPGTCKCTPKKKKVAEMRDKRDAYQRDYDSSIAGMDKKSSLAYQLDGGANDEGDDESFLRAQQEKDRGPWYLRVNGKILKSQGQPKVFDMKKGANNYALAIIKNKPELQGKIMLTKRAEDDISETATAGSTSAANVSVGAVYKNKKAKMQKPGTNALDMKGGNLLTGGSIKR